MCRILQAVVILLLLVGSAPAEEARQSIPGTTVSVVPLQGYLPAGNGLTALLNRRTGGGVVVMSFPPQAFDELAKDDDVARLSKVLSQGAITLDDAEITTLGGHDALLMHGQQRIEGVDYRKWIALLRADRTILLNVQVPESRAPDDATVMAMLNSVEIGPEPTIDERVAQLPFKLTEKGSFRPVMVLAGTTLLMTIGDKDVVPAMEQPILVLTFSPTPVPDTISQKSFALRGLSAQKSLKVGKLISESEGKALGPNVVEVVAEAEDLKSGADVNLIEWVHYFSKAICSFRGLRGARRGTMSWARCAPSMTGSS